MIVSLNKETLPVHTKVWKDVDGVLTSDPRIVDNTRPVNELTFEEATELAYFGAQVGHVCL